MKTNPHSFDLRLRALPNYPGHPEQRLRAALTHLLRAWGLRAEICRPVATIAPAAPERAGSINTAERSADAL
jgi:hypothetical protein